MQVEIKRIGLVGAGSLCGGVTGIATLAAALVFLVASVLVGDLAWLEGLIAEESGLDPSGEASATAAIAVMLAATLALGGVVVGFALGLFLAAVYNVTAGFAGGLVVEMRPLPER